LYPFQSLSVGRLWLFFLVLVPLACGHTAGTTAGPRLPPPLYDGEAAKLFDDRIDSNAVGLADVTTNPRTDAVLRARTQKAEGAGRMKVSTVSVDSADGQPTYRLSLAFIDAPVSLRGFGETHVELVVRPDSPSFGIVKWLDAGLIGRTFFCFFRRFAAGDETQVRYHISADSNEVLAAAREAHALGELSAK
jgi:hypothetical protein